MKKSLILSLLLTSIALTSCQISNNTKTSIISSVKANDITLGQYPQTLVEDSELISKLNNIESTSNTIELEGLKYEKVTASPYYDSNDIKSNSGNTTFKTGETYYFLYEDIEWYGISYKEDIIYFSKYILDKHEFSNNLSIEEKDNTTIYPNQYLYSDIKEYLNTTFLDFAFNEDEKATIKLSSNRNDLASFGNNKLLTFAETKNSDDYVFLLSYEEITNYTNLAYIKQGNLTDYAKAVGTFYYLTEDDSHLDLEDDYIGRSSYYLRSPIKSSNNVCIYDYKNDISAFGVNKSYMGLRPAIRLN